MAKNGKMKVGKNFRNLGNIEPWNQDWVEIGDHCLLGGESKIILHGPIRPYKENNKVIIGDLSWTGFRCLILPGTKIGRCCLVGATSLVFGDFPSYSIIAGNPAKAIRRRDGYELLRFFVIRILQDKVLGVDEPDWSRLKMNHIKYVFGYGSDDPFDPDLDLDNMTVEEVLDHYRPKN